MKSFLRLPDLQLFYAVFALSWLPLYFIIVHQERWLYTFFYRPFGFVENMTVVLYTGAAAFSAFALYKLTFTRTLIAIFLFSLFMIGEETRWGLGFFYENLKTLPFTGVQDLLEISFLKWNIGHTPVQEHVVYMTRFFVFFIVSGIVFYGWYRRHDLTDIFEYLRHSSRTPLLICFLALFLGAVFVEVVLQPGPRKLDYLEETLEMNAALVWMILALSFMADPDYLVK